MNIEFKFKVFAPLVCETVGLFYYKNECNTKRNKYLSIGVNPGKIEIK
jgi:hypothetical protein